MCVDVCLHVYKYTTCVSGVCQVQKRASNPLDLELQRVVSHPVDAGTRSGSSANVFNQGAIPLACVFSFSFF